MQNILRSKGLAVIISAPSGCGKSTIVKILQNKIKNSHISISYTTRSKRPKEVNGKDYHFISKEEFKDKINKNEFLEYAEVFNNYYGTRINEVNKLINDGKVIFFDIDWQGAISIKSKLNLQVITIYLIPPSVNILKKRLIKRNQDDLNIIEYRMNELKNDLKQISNFKYAVINNNLDDTVNEILSIIKAELYKVKYEDNLDQFITKLEN